MAQHGIMHRFKFTVFVWRQTTWKHKSFCGKGTVQHHLSNISVVCFLSAAETLKPDNCAVFPLRSTLYYLDTWMHEVESCLAGNGSCSHFIQFILVLPLSPLQSKQCNLIYKKSSLVIWLSGGHCMIDG